jgi:hypothetical protein
MNAPCPPIPAFPLNPTVGQRYLNYVWNGVRWVCSPAKGIITNQVVFLASAPYQPSPGLVSATVRCIGGGGGGAGVFLPNNTYAGAGGGGGSGGYSEIILAAALLAGGVVVTIGAGGAASEIVGAAPSGEPTSFGAFCIANGGGGGFSATTSTWGSGGLGAAPGVGTIAFPGNTGESGYLLIGIPVGEIGIEAGAGAPSALGGGVRGGGNQGTTQPGPSAYPNTGSGGAGAWQNWATVSIATAGGAGGSGICIVNEQIWADTFNDCGCDDGQMLPARVGWCPPGGWQE